MSNQTSFRSVVRPITKTISTVLAGTALDFSGRATNLDFTANQSNTFTSLVNHEHLIDGQSVIITNKGTAAINIGADLMANGSLYDIEAGMTAVFIYIAGSQKFFDAGGSATSKDVQENLDQTNTELTFLGQLFATHEHTGGDNTKIKVTNLDPNGVTGQDKVLCLSASNIPEFRDVRTYIQATARWANTDISTDITPGSTWTEIPIMGTQERRDNTSIFLPYGNGIQLNWTGKIKVRTLITAITSVQNTQLEIAIKKNTVVLPRISSDYARAISGADSASCFLHDEVDVLPGDVIYVVARQGGATGSMTMSSSAGCYLEVEIPPAAFAKGDQGDPGYAGWAYIAQAGAPSSLLGNDGDVYLNTDNGDFYQRAAGTWSLRTNLKGAQGEQGISKSTIWAEKLGTLTNGTEEWSFGASSASGAGRGIMQMVNGKITHLGLDCRTAGTSSVSVEILLNGVSTGQSITLSPSVFSGYVALTTPVTFSVGDIIGFRTVVGGGAANARVAALVAHEGVVVAPVGYVIPTVWKHSVTLTTTDVTNEYIDLPHLALANTIKAFIGRLAIHQNEDFTVAANGGISRITFINDLASGGLEAIEAGDKLFFHYSY